MLNTKNEIINLTNDIAFKSFFLNENNKWYLSFLISYCTKLNINEIYNNIKYKSDFISNINIDKKIGYSDILVEVKNMVINIEMNNEVTENLIRKNKKYVSALENLNTEKTKNGKIKDKYIIQINISTKARIKGTNELMYEIVQMDRNIKKEDECNNYIIYDINLDYLKKELYNKNKLTRSEKRLLIFIERDMDKLKKIYEGDSKMKKAVDDLDSLRYFEEFEKITEMYNTEEFRKIIEEEAREEEIKEAKEKGIIERNKEIAKTLISLNIKIEDIIKVTGLTKEEIEKLV